MILPSKPITLKNGKKITLRTLKPFEAQAFLQHVRISHKESYQNLNRGAEFYENISVADQTKSLANFQDSNSSFILGAFHDEVMVGGLGFFGGDAEYIERNATFGMSIQKKYCKTGLGTAMVQYMLEQAKVYGFHRIELSVRTYNEGGIALYEKVGFKRIGTRSEIAFIDGKFVDEYYYEILLK